MGLERKKFLIYALVLMFVTFSAGCVTNTSERVAYVKNGETYLYEKNKSYNLGNLSKQVRSDVKYTYYLTDGGELCSFYGGKIHTVTRNVEKYDISGKYVFYIKNKKLYKAKGNKETILCTNAEDFDVINGCCVYKNNGNWYCETNKISDVKPFFATEKYAYYLKNDTLYYKRYGEKAAAVSDNVYETAVVANCVYFFEEKYTEKEFDEIFEYDCAEKDNGNKYDEHINHADTVKYFEQNKIPFRLYILYEAEFDTKKKIDEDICDIGSFYDVGEKCAVYRKMSKKKLKFSSVKNINDVYRTAEEKYVNADIYIVQKGEKSLKIRDCSADYFEIGNNNIYYTVSGKFYENKKKIADNVLKFKVTALGTIFSDENKTYLYCNEKIREIGRDAENIKCSAEDVYFIDGGNLKNTSGTLYKNVKDYKLCGKDLYCIIGGDIYKNEEKIDTDVSEIY